MIPTSPKSLYQTAPKVRVSKWKCLFAEITDASVVFGFTENGLVCARQKNVLILQFIDILKSVANPLCSCFSDPVLLIFPRLSRANGYVPVPVLVVLKVILRVSGRVFKLSCSRAFLRLHILVIPRSNLVANEDDTFIGNRGGGFIRVLLFAWFYLSSGSPVSAKHSKNGECSCSHGLLPFISHTRLLVQRAVRVSSLVIVWRESSSEADSKRRYRRSR